MTQTACVSLYSVSRTHEKEFKSFDRPASRKPYKTDSCMTIPPFFRICLIRFPRCVDFLSCVQRYSWPLAMQGYDVIGVAATGSGKTLWLAK